MILLIFFENQNKKLLTFLKISDIIFSEHGKMEEIVWKKG